MKEKFLFVIIVCIALGLKAQVGIHVGLSELKFTGDVGKNGNSNFLNDARSGYNFGLDYRCGKFLGFGVNGLYGKLVGTDNNSNSHRNFQSTVVGGEFNVSLYFDKIHDTVKTVSPFLSIGLGYIKFDPKGDNLDANGNRYYYWNDGSMRNLPESAANDPVSTKLKRDYKYETTLTDSATNYSRGCLYLPINVGAKFQIGFRTSLRLSVNYNIAFSDYIDNYKNGGNDSWIGLNTTLRVAFGKKPHDIYANIDFSALDAGDYDKDGVADDHDRCMGTPKGVSVDSHGCPIDSDGDDIADYLDNEPATKKGAMVDGHGVTINEDELARLQRELDLLFEGVEEPAEKKPK